jgi:hypothetical protein
MAMSADWTGWSLEDSTLRCSYEYRNVGSSKLVARLLLECVLEPGPGGLSVQPFHFIHLEPFRTNGPSCLVLFFGAGTSIGKFFSVSVDSGNGERAMIRLTSREDVLECVKALCSGVELQFLLKGPTNTYAHLPVPNNLGFRELYDKAYRATARSPDRTGKRPGLFARLFK